MNYEEILAEISPSKEEDKEIKKTIKKISSEIEKNAKQKKYSLEVVAGGSTAK